MNNINLYKLYINVEAVFGQHSIALPSKQNVDSALANRDQFAVSINRVTRPDVVQAGSSKRLGYWDDDSMGVLAGQPMTALLIPEMP